MDKQSFSDEQILKVLLLEAKKRRKLNNSELKYDSKFTLPSDNRCKEIIAYLSNKKYVNQMLLPIQDGNVTRYQFINAGLSPNGEDYLADLINTFEKKKKEERKEIRRDIKRDLISALIGAILTIATQFLLKLLGLLNFSIPN